MSLTVGLGILAVLATLAAAFLQPLVGHWLMPKQKLRADIMTAEFALPKTVSKQMVDFYYKLHSHRQQPRAEFGEFLKLAEQYRTYFNITVTNTGRTISRNVILGCSALSKYVLISSRNRIEFHADQTEYLLGDLQPSEKVNCLIWSSSSFPNYEPFAREFFSLRDDHNSPREIILRRYYDRTTHYLVERSIVI